MMPYKILKDNDIELSEKGREAFIKAARDVFPNILIQEAHDNEVFEFFMYGEITEKQCMELLGRTIRYAKVWEFS